jgi:hypothetical protein
VVFGETLWVRLSVTCAPPAIGTAEVRIGEFWKLFGSAEAPCPLLSLAVAPSSLGKTNPLVKSMPSRNDGLLRPFAKTELPRMLLPVFWIGVALLGRGLPKIAMPPVPLNATRLPRPVKFVFG